MKKYSDVAAAVKAVRDNRRPHFTSQVKLDDAIVQQLLEVDSTDQAMDELGCGRCCFSIEFDGGLFLLRAEKEVYPPVFWFGDYLNNREEKP